MQDSVGRQLREAENHLVRSGTPRQQLTRVGARLLGRWRASRGVGDEIVIATKVGARPIAPAAGFDTPREGLSRAAIREASERSRERLSVERIDLYYAHVPDQTGVPLDEQVAAFGELVAEGAVGLLGLSNHWAWQVERVRGLAAAAGSVRADVLQYHHTYLRMRHRYPRRPFLTRR